MITVKVTADDFGYCRKRNAGIIELCKEGLIHKLSLLVNGVECEDAVSSFKALPLSTRKHIKLGLHLNLTEGDPVAEKSTVSSLLNSAGHFLGKMGLRDETVDISESEVRCEMIGQINRFCELIGHLPEFIDGHQHIHVCPKVQQIFAETLCLYGIKETRIPIELEVERCNWLNDQQLLFFSIMCKHAELAKENFLKNGLLYQDFFIGLSTMGKNMTIGNLKAAFENIRREVALKALSGDEGVGKGCEIEFMVHPGYRSEAGNGGCGLGPDNFSMSHEREIEFHFLKNQFREVLSSLGLKLAPPTFP